MNCILVLQNPLETVHGKLVWYKQGRKKVKVLLGEPDHLRVRCGQTLAAIKMEGEVSWNFDYCIRAVNVRAEGKELYLMAEVQA